MDLLGMEGGHSSSTAESISTTLHATSLFSLSILSKTNFLKIPKNIQKIPKKLWETTRSIFRMFLPQHVLKEKGKKTGKFSKWISFIWPTPLYRANMQGCYFPLLTDSSFSSLIQPSWPSSHLSSFLLFSYLVHRLKLYISARFLEHLNKCLQLTIQHLIYHLFFVVVSCIVILLLCLTQLQMIQSCVR